MPRFISLPFLFIVFILTLAPNAFAAVESIVGLSKAKPNAAAFKDASRRKPIEIKTADGLAKYFGKEQAVAITKEVDFKKQVVLIFAWRGSGQDRLNFDVLESCPEQIIFKIKPGRTKDLRPHVHVFAVRKQAIWSVK